MSIKTHRVTIGACGWQHQNWLGDFYPDDLPEDWYLGYYANEFSVVYVPASSWVNESDISVWGEDVAETFRFILEVPSKILTDQKKFEVCLNKAKSLGEMCLGLVFQLNQAICEDQAAFLKQLATGQTIATVCVDKRGLILSDEFQDLLKKNDISEVWNGGSQSIASTDELTLTESGLKQGSLALTHVFSEDLDTARLRKVIEVSLAAASEERVSVLCIDGNPPSIEVLRNADIILNLL